MVDPAPERRNHSDGIPNWVAVYVKNFGSVNDLLSQPRHTYRFQNISETEDQTTYDDGWDNRSEDFSQHG